MTKPRNRQPDWGRVPLQLDAKLITHHQPAPQNRVFVWCGEWTIGYWNGKCFEDEDGFTIYEVVIWAYPPKIEAEVNSDA